jgi:hypothetical protein
MVNGEWKKKPFVHLPFTIHHLPTKNARGRASFWHKLGGQREPTPRAALQIRSGSP